ncbi:heterokaryon incompatibility protein-domain-containing protein [Phaeosphaeriaceae sp. PMI808]|nr:heterokaryon incompatibility protein-domain-containing protein [Phaeosphaeriaceae sp. PMI808]
MKRVNALLNRSTPHKREPTQGPTTEQKTFEHKPLDSTQATLRLVTISSELSTDGCIQCYVSHSTIDRASYVSLSYTWGSPEGLVRIQVNGAPFYIRKNLYEFLDLVRRLPMTFYWIDAICIDQANILERNHQVSQMGRIFSKAFIVYIWLGKLPSMVPWMHDFVKGKMQRPYEDFPLSRLVEARDTVQSCVFNNEYWSRAWVTQEIFLARNVVVLLCRESFKFPQLINRMRSFDNIDFGTLSGCPLARFADLISDPEKLRHQSLIVLLDKFRDKECEIPRDRIFSLLSLCSDFQHPQVDYSQPSEDLAYDVLKRSDAPICICSALLVAQTLRLAASQEGDEESASQTKPMTFIELDIKGLRFARHAMLCNDQIYSWDHYKLIRTDMFGHDQLFTDFCPAFDTLMDTLQARAMKSEDIASSEVDDISSMHTETPFVLKMMDDNHCQAMLHDFGPALTIKPHDANPDISTLRIALHLLAKILPHSIQLCPRIAHRKEVTKIHSSHEAPSPTEKDGSLYTTRSMHPRNSVDMRNFNPDFHRIDSATTSASYEDDGLVSRLRLWRTQR